MAQSELRANDHRPIPFYRDVKMLAVLAQAAFVVAVALAGWWLINNMLISLRSSRIPLDFGFLDQVAGFAIPDSSIAYAPTDTYQRAFLVGLINTFRVSLLGIVLATVLGVLIGVMRLSSNWLLRNLASAYVTIFRNTPLAVQLIFWSLAVILKLPRVRESVNIGGLIFLNNRGLTVAWPLPGPSFGMWVYWLWGGLLVGVAVYIVRRRMLVQRGVAGMVLPHALLAAGAVVLVGALVSWGLGGGSPLVLSLPELAGFNFTGGVTLNAAFFALLLGLTVYTAAFIAEVVRAGIQAVNKGQREAAAALGLPPGQTLRLVIFPQALRVIIPPLTNQYLNLTKNSSLGIVVAFPDLFYVGTTINNQSGRAVQVILILMVCYLTLSLLTSLITNLYNWRIRLIER